VRDPRVAALHRPVRGAVHEPLHQAGPVDNRFRAGVVAVSTTATSTAPSTGVGDVLDVAAALRPKRDAEVCLAATTAAAAGTVTTTGALDRLSGTHGPLRRERLARPGRAQHPIPRIRHARSRSRNLCRLRRPGALLAAHEPPRSVGFPFGGCVSPERVICTSCV